MIKTFSLQTPRTGFIDVTDRVRAAVSESGVMEGLALVYCPHTTAGITVNENADPDVLADLTLALEESYPDRPAYMHIEGNSAAHAKASAIGSGVTLIITGGRPLLGTWQGVYFCEFDGPRSRRLIVKTLEG